MESHPGLQPGVSAQPSECSPANPRGDVVSEGAAAQDRQPFQEQQAQVPSCAGEAASTPSGKGNPGHEPRWNDAKNIFSEGSVHATEDRAYAEAQGSLGAYRTS